MEIPPKFYYLLGFFIFTNLTVIGGAVWGGLKLYFKGADWFIRTNVKLETIEEFMKEERGAKSMAIRAHKRVDLVERDAHGTDD